MEQQEENSSGLAGSKTSGAQSSEVGHKNTSSDQPPG